jgi:hypothetical protein
VILPDTVQGTGALKLLLLNGMRVIVSPSDTLMSISLAQTLETIQTLFFAQETEDEIPLDPGDIYRVIPEGTITQQHESSGTNLSTTMMKLFSLPQRLDDAAGAIIHFALHEERPLLEISEAMDIAEAQLPDNALVLLSVRNSTSDLKKSTITSLISRYYDFEQELQDAIDATASYLGKLSVIIDAFASHVISGEAADALAEKNRLDPNDMLAMYRLIYERPASTVELINIFGNETLEDDRKIEAAADAIITESVPNEIVEALVNMKHLPIEEILSIVNLKQEGKLPLRSMEMPHSLQDRYANLQLAKSADILVLLNKETPRQERNGRITIEITELKLYENHGAEWYVSKDLTEAEIDLFVNAYLAQVE